MISRNSLGNIYPIKKLGDVADFLDSRRKPVKECDRIIGPYPYYGANGLQGWINDFLFDENLILLAEDGGHFDNPDRGVAYKISGKTWVNNHAHVIKPKEGVDLDYLCRVLENYDLTPWITGTTRGKLTKGGASEILIPLPPIAEQRRIASILDQADELRQKRQQAIEKLDQLLQATFIDMFGDPVSNPKGWEVKKLSELSTKIHSGNTPKGGSENYVDQGIIFLRSQNVWKNKVILDDVAYIDAETHSKMMKSSVKHEDLLMTKTGRINTENSSLGRAAIYLGEDDSANINGHVYLIRIKDGFNKYFILRILTLPDYYEYIRSVCVGGIDKRQLNKEHIENFPIIQPPMELQNKFSNIVQVIESQKPKLLEQLDLAENLFKTLQQKAFNGTL
ncbi:restriction endonuclease subunit S [Acinetobacter indicus]|uniref:restriction endonuclease subunit S n=1 Tax=Acinetobacter indicus TaxID=756892 RepID=UPI003989D155